MIRRRPDPVPPDQINTSPDLILPVSLQLLRGKSAQDGISLSPTALILTIHLYGSVKSSPPTTHKFFYSCWFFFFLEDFKYFTVSITVVMWQSCNSNNLREKIHVLKLNTGCCSYWFQKSGCFRDMVWSHTIFLCCKACNTMYILFFKNLVY